MATPNSSVVRAGILVLLLVALAAAVAWSASSLSHPGLTAVPDDERIGVGTEDGSISWWQSMIPDQGLNPLPFAALLLLFPAISLARSGYLPATSPVAAPRGAFEDQPQRPG